MKNILISKQCRVTIELIHVLVCYKAGYHRLWNLLINRCKESMLLLKLIRIVIHSLYWLMWINVLNKVYNINKPCTTYIIVFKLLKQRATYYWWWSWWIEQSDASHFMLHKRCQQSNMFAITPLYQLVVPKQRT